MDQPRPPRSCTLCRQRKIKCDRQQPCGNCIRLESTCIYPAGFGRAPKRPRKAVEARLLAQLSRLESAVRRMEGQASSTLSTPTTTAARTNSNETENGTINNLDENEDNNSNTKDPNASIDSQIGRLVIDENQSCYVSSAPWAQLGDEIEEMRDLLHHPPSDDEKDELEQGSVSASTEGHQSGSGSGSGVGTGAGANGALLGYRALAHSLATYHPPLSQAVLLFDIFKANVSPLIRIFHTPSLDRLFWDAIASMDALDKNIEALLFAIYYAAVISLESEECLAMFGTSRPALLETYRFATEQATARADLLNTQNFILLQATVVFLVALRNEDDSRTVWSLTALVYHIAQAMGLHRDGEAFGLRPLETELRRRLWWHICLLDNRSTDYHGSEPIVHEHIFDTKMPLHINDADITADMTVPPGEREEATEMTLCLIRCHSMRVIWKVGYMAPQELRNADRKNLDMGERQSLVEELEGLLQEKYLRHCDPNLPFGRLALMVAKVITRRIWMTVLCSRSQTDRAVRDRLFRDSVEVLQYSRSLLTDREIHQWAWHSKTHIQWYSVAILLAELCRRPPGPECDEAWECVDTIYERWSLLEAEKRGTLWRPIRRLMARARYVRDVQWKAATANTNANGTGTGTGSSSIGLTTAGTPRQPGIGALANTCVFAGVKGFAFPSEPMEPQGHGSVAEIDPLMELPPLNAPGLLDASVMDLFGFFSETPAAIGTPRYTPDMNVLPP